MAVNWIDLDGLANMRDVGGIPTVDGGVIAERRLLRSDNLQTLTEGDLARLAELGLTDVIDLRSHVEVDAEGDGPLRAVDGVRFHHHSFFIEDGDDADTGAKALPWVGLRPAVEVADFQASTYLSFLADRPDSVVAALRAIAAAEGAALVHCAAGKDRTGTTVALALMLAGAERAAVVADYAASNERMQRIVDRLMTSPTYRPNLEGRPLSSHATNPETMDAFLAHAEERAGGVEGFLAPLGWTPADTEAMRRKLR